MSAVTTGATRVRRALLVVPALLVALVAAACAPVEPIALDTDTVIVDVRTPAEFAEGHLEGAVNIDVSAPDFQAQIAQLDTDADYVVYCRSGNRSAQAISIMRDAGFTSLQNAGGLSDAAAAISLPIVR